MRRFLSALVLVPALLPVRPPAPAAAQEPAGWNQPRTLELVARARERRREPVADSSLLNYRADVTGHVYFFLDAEGQPEPVLLRADQVALELYWAQPGRVKQVIRGMRSEEQLPIRDFAYYLDRYTVIQNGLGDIIRVGEGRDVHDVPHPLAPGAEAVYDYRLADSLEIRLPARPDPIRVYEVQVRPRDYGRPAIVGSLFVERARGDLVRLAFTFTPASYLDPRNERVEIALENALWEDRYWLPREQRLLVRRELPQLDLGVGTVIRAALRVTRYDLNTEIPLGFFDGRTVITAAGPRGLEQYPFEEGLFDGLDELGLTGDELATLDEVDVDAIAGRIVRQRYLRGMRGLRFHAPDASSVLRYDRAEGTVTGAGWTFGVGDRRLDLYGGYAWRAGEPTASIRLRPLVRAASGSHLEAYYRRPIDLGLRPAAAGLASSLAAAAFGTDYRDLYFASGVSVSTGSGEAAGDGMGVELAWERHHSPDTTLAAIRSPWNDATRFRPVLPVRQGDRILARATARRGSGPVAMSAFTEAGWFDEAFFARSGIDLRAHWRDERRRWAIDGRLAYRATNAGSPVQHHWLVGGPNTIPGHPLHGYLAERLVLIDGEASREVVPRWLRLRALGAFGYVDARAAGVPAIPATEPWTLPETEVGLGSLGLGIATLDGILRLDYAIPFGGRGDRDGALILSIDPRFWPIL